MGGAKGGRVKKQKTLSAEECLPDPYGRRVVPCVDEDLKKKVEKLDAAKAGGGTKGRVRLNMCCVDFIEVFIC